MSLTSAQNWWKLLQLLGKPQKSSSTSGSTTRLPVLELSGHQNLFFLVLMASKKFFIVSGPASLTIAQKSPLHQKNLSKNCRWKISRKIMIIISVCMIFFDIFLRPKCTEIKTHEIIRIISLLINCHKKKHCQLSPHVLFYDGFIADCICDRSVICQSHWLIQ